MQVLDPAGTEMRKAHRLVQRVYTSPGPNFVWHIDGYDKLKPFGLCIHGAVDGFSRKILWLEVAPTNNNPNTIANYYLDSVKREGGVPRIVRSDLGTENAVVKNLQIYLRRDGQDGTAGLNSFIQGKSTSNQRIEAFWSMLRKMLINNWIIVFKDMRSYNIYNDGDPVHVECLKFCFMDLLQVKLDEFVTYWNLHKPRNNRQLHTIQGKPDVMFRTLQSYAGQDMKILVDLDTLDACKELYPYIRPLRGCSDEFRNLISLIDPTAITRIPDTIGSALDMYGSLLAAIDKFRQ